MVNLHRLAGLPRLIGIEFSESEVRVSEAEGPKVIHRTGSEAWHTIWSKSANYSWESPPDEIGAQIKDLLKEKNSRASRAHVALRSQGVRIVRSEVPEGEARIPEWIEDHADKLLQLPIPLRDLAFDFRSFTEENSGSRIEIAFARRQEIEKTLMICRAAGLHPVSIGATIDLAHPDRKIYEFLPQELKAADETRTYRNLVQRVGLASGVTLLILLFLQLLASWYVESRVEELDESSHASEAMVQEVAGLEASVVALKAQLTAIRYGTLRTQLARTLHDVARSVPKGIRLLSLSIQESKNGGTAFVAKGEVHSHECLASYLAVLDTSAFCEGVILTKSGSEKDSWGAEKTTRAGAIVFELQGELR